MHPRHKVIKQRPKRTHLSCKAGDMAINIIQQNGEVEAHSAKKEICVVHSTKPHKSQPADQQ
jgi:hypothetical protein